MRDSPIRAALRSPLVIVLAALVMRLLVMAWLYRGPSVAILQHFSFPSEMARVARSIATGQGFSSPLLIPTGPTALVPPVYPYLLAGIFRLFGVYTFASAVAILSLNSLFSALTCLPILALGRRAFGASAATAAAWVWVFFPNAMFIPVNWLWETSLATLLLSLLVLLAARLDESPSLTGWIGFGLLWGAAALTSPALLTVLPFLVGWLCVRLSRSGKRFFAPAGAAALAFLLCVVPWMARNYLTFGRFIPFRSGFGLELRVGNSAETGVRWRSWLHPNETPSEALRMQRLGEVAYMDEKHREAMEFISAYPGTFLWLTAKRVAFIWTGVWNLSPAYLRANPGETASIFINTALTVIAFAGLGLAFRRRIPFAWLCTLVFLSEPLVYYVTHVNIRYRHPMDPFLILLAVFAVMERRPDELK